MSEPQIDLSTFQPLQNSPTPPPSTAPNVEIDPSTIQPIKGNFLGKVWDEVGAGFKRFGQNVGEGLLRANASAADLERGILKVLPDPPDIPEALRPTGGMANPSVEAKKRVLNWLKGASNQSNKMASDIGIPEDQKGIPDIVISRASQMAAQLPEYALTGAAGPIVGFAGQSALEAYGQDATPEQVALAAAQGATTGAIFQGSAPLARTQRMLTQAAGLGTTTALQGGSAKDIAESVASGGVLGAMGPKEGLKFRDLLPQKTAVNETAIQTAPTKPIPTPAQVETIKASEMAKGEIAGTGLDTGKMVENRVAFRPDKINAPEDVQNLIQSQASSAEQFKAQRISKNDANIQALAKDVGVSVDDLIKTKPGSIANAETIFKSRQVVTDLAQDLQNTLRSIDTATATPEQLQMIKEKTFRLQGAMKAVAGFRTEASHIFRQFQMKSSPGETDILRGLATDLKQLDASAAGDLSAFARGTKELMEPTMADKAWHLWYSSVLSGPSTHAKNVLGNTASMITEVGRVAVTSPTQLPSAIAGLFDGLVKGAKEGGRVLKEGEPSKFEERGLKPIVFSGPAKILNAADYIGRALSAEDAFFKGGFRGMEQRQLAREQAVKEGLTGSARRARIEELYRNPTPEIQQGAQDYALYGTYNQKPQGIIGSIANAIGNVTREHPSAKLVVPFTRVVANVVNNALDYTPAGVTRAVSGKFKGTLNERQFHQELGRGVLGTVAMTYFAHLAAEGQLTGNGPTDPNKKAQMIAAGWRPNAIKIGNTYYPYQNLGPLAMPMALVGNYFDAAKYGNLDKKDLIDRATAATLGSANTILSMSFLSGVSSLVTAINDWSAKGSSFLKNFISQQASSVVPSAVKQIAGYFDVQSYDAQTIGEKIQASVHVTSGLKPKLDVFGDPIKKDPVSGLTPSKITNDPVKKYLSDAQLFISVPSKNTEIRDAKTGEKRPMNRDEYYIFMERSGKQIKEALSGMIPTLESIPDQEQRQKIVDKIVDKIRGGVKKQIGGETALEPTDISTDQENP